MLKLEIEKPVARLLAFGAPFISIFLLIDQVSDPVNVTKMAALSVVAFGLAAVVLVKSPRLLWSDAKLQVVAALGFIVFSISAVLNSSSPLGQNFYGTYGRNTGFLTYFSLTLVFVATLVLRRTESFRNILYGLLAAGLVNVAYGAWTITFGDFVSWNNPYNRILGTFGNPNFIGAFLGIFASVLVAYLLTPGTKLAVRLAGAVILIATFLEIKSSLAVQGIVVSGGGIALVIFYYLRSKFTKWTVPFIYLGSVAVVGIFALMGALQKGPLTSLVYKTSVSLRGEYWQAGINMGNSHPLTGVGMDSYGDWYRRSRDAQALILPGPNTTTNAAHNVFIDVFAYGGYPLFIAYMAIFVMGLIAAVKLTFIQKEFNFVKVGLIVAWICYQVQALISINQVGLAVWGWVTSGALISYEFSTRSAQSESTSKVSARKTVKNNPLISPQMLIGLGMVVGIIIAIPPLSGDIKWREALKAQNADLVTVALTPSYMSPASSNLYINATQIFEQNNLPAMAYKYGKLNTEYNPNNFDAWRFLYVLKNSTSEDRKLAKEKMIELDPLNDEWKKLP
jgi:VanZ family protein